MRLPFHSLLLSTHLIFHKKVFTNLSDTGLTFGQPKVLDYLKDHDGCVQKDIAAACEIEPPTVTSLLQRMEESGLIERKMLNGNRRSLYVFLTDKGRTAQEKVSTVFDQLENLAFEGLTKEEAETFMNLFSKINQNLTKQSR